MNEWSSNVGCMMTTTNDPESPTYIDLAAAAERTGIRYRTLRNYHHRAERHRRLAVRDKNPNYIRPGDLPKPDNTFGRSPVWHPETIDQWFASRPGQGKGGGRPVGWSPKRHEKNTKEAGVRDEGIADHDGNAGGSGDEPAAG